MIDQQVSTTRISQELTMNPKNAPSKVPSKRAKRRRFSTKYKLKIVEEAQTCHEPGQITALLKREGLYSSELTLWRRQYRASAIDAFKAIKRGRKPCNTSTQKTLERLRQENERLMIKLKQVQTTIELQRKLTEKAMAAPSSYHAGGLVAGTV
jgi:transposase-like protein